MGRPRSLTFGVGINDLPYNVAIRDGNNKQILCPYYASWRRMFRRCYSKGDQGDHPTYHGASVSQEWKTATVFKAWMEKQIWKGLHLDKDILGFGDKTYSSNNCAFIPQRINKLLLIRDNDRGAYPLGVSLRSNPHGYVFSKPLVTQLTSVDNRVRCVGYFDDSIEAHRAWQWAKAAEIENSVNWYATQVCFRTDVADALMVRVWKLRIEHDQGVETTRL